MSLQIMHVVILVGAVYMASRGRGTWESNPTSHAELS